MGKRQLQITCCFGKEDAGELFISLVSAVSPPGAGRGPLGPCPAAKAPGPIQAINGRLSQEAEYVLEISNPMDYHVGLYIRLSKEDENEGPSESVNNQRSMLEEFVKQHRLSVFDTYVDDGWSGTNFDRPDFQRLIADIEAKKVNMVFSGVFCAIMGLNQKDLENQGILA